MVAVLGNIRPGLVFSTIVFSILAFFAAGRTIAGAALGLTLGQGRRLAAMSVRTAMLQFGYLLGTLLGGAMLSQWGYAGIGWAFAGLFAAAAALRIPQLQGSGAIGGSGADQLRRRRRRD
jgi:predicted MFS family arabinose efflux permease